MACYKGVCRTAPATPGLLNIRNVRRINGAKDIDRGKEMRSKTLGARERNEEKNFISGK